MKKFFKTTIKILIGIVILSMKLAAFLIGIVIFMLHSTIGYIFLESIEAFKYLSVSYEKFIEKL